MARLRVTGSRHTTKLVQWFLAPSIWGGPLAMPAHGHAVNPLAVLPLSCCQPQMSYQPSQSAC